MSDQVRADASITSVSMASMDSTQAAAPSSEAERDHLPDSISPKVVARGSCNSYDFIHASIGGQFHGDGLTGTSIHASPSRSLDGLQDDRRALVPQGGEPGPSQGGQVLLLTVGQEPDWAAKLGRRSPSESTLPRGSAANSEGTRSHRSRSPSSSFSKAEAGSVFTNDTALSN